MRESLKVLKKKTDQCMEHLKALLEQLKDGLLDVSSDQDGDLFQNEADEPWPDPAGRE